MPHPDEALDFRNDAESPAQVREFTDADGVRWHVSEQAYPRFDRRQGASLIFESDAAVRRIRNFPPDWHALTNDELLELSWRV